MSILSIGGLGGGAQPPQSQRAQAPGQANEPNKQANRKETAEPNQAAATPQSQPQQTTTPTSKPVEATSRPEAVDFQTARAEPIAQAQGSDQRLSSAVDELSQARAQAMRVVDELRTEGIISALSQTPDAGTLLQSNAKEEAPARAEAAFNEMKDVDAAYSAKQDGEGLSSRV